MTFEMRTKCPDRSNLYYVQIAHGGWSPCALGTYSNGSKATDGWVLPDCVGYAVGRFNEIGGYRSCKYLKSVNAEDFIENRGDLSYGQEPRVGACAVWKDGPYSGLGHVAIVEKVVNENEIITSESTSESGYKSNEFWTKTRTRNGGNWGAQSTYKFLGFIYHPDVDDSGKSTTNQTAIDFTNNNVTNYNSDNSKYSVIDVSYCQPNLDWSKIKSTSVKCKSTGAALKPIKAAIIRVGFNGKNYNKDNLVDYHIAGCAANNIPFGLYWYVQNYAADPVSWGEGIAKYMLDFYNGLSDKAKALCKFPLYLDIEDPKYTSSAYNSTNAILASSYCKYILKNGNGLVPGIYAAVGHCIGYINDVGKRIDPTPVSFAYTDADGNRKNKTICKGDLLYSKWMARWRTGTNKTLLSGGYQNINPPIALWQQFGDGAPAQIGIYKSHVDMNNCFIDYATSTVSTPVSDITDDSIARELIISCLEDYYTIDFDDYKSTEAFKAALEDLHGLLSQAIIPMSSANIMIENVTKLFRSLQLKDTTDNFDEPGGYEGIVNAFVKEKDTINALELPDYTDTTAAVVKSALAAAAYLPAPEKKDDKGNPIYDKALMGSLNSYRLSEFKKHTKALKNARKNLELKELDKNAEVVCTVNGKECLMSFNKLCEVIKNIKKEDFTEASYNELVTNYLNADISKMGQSELSALIKAGVEHIASMTPVLANCTEFFRARLRAAVRRDYSHESSYSAIIPEDKTTWDNFTKNDGSAEGYTTRYTAASREPVDSLCSIFDTFVKLQDLSSNFPELSTSAPICLQSEVNQLTAELNAAVDNLVTDISSTADEYADVYSKLAEYTHSIGIEASAKIILYSLLESLYTSDSSAANEDQLNYFIGKIKEALGELENGAISSPDTGEPQTLYISADYSALTDLLLIVKMYDRRRFTDSSFSNLENVVATVKSNTNYEAGPRKTFKEQYIIDEAVEELRAAINSLELREEPLAMVFTKNTSASSVESPNIALNTKDKIIKDNIDIVISVYTEGKLYYINTVDQLKRDLSLNTNVYFKLRSLYKNNISSIKIEDWEYTYYVDNAGNLETNTQIIELCYGCVYRKTSEGSIEVWKPESII